MFNLTTNLSIKHLIHAISVAWILNVIMAYTLWLPELRRFPQIAATDFHVHFSNLQRYILYFFAIISLIIANFSLKNYTIAIIIFLAIFGLAVLEDVNRLQSYFYFYCCVFVVISLHINKENESNIHLNTEFVICRDILVLLFACYFWSGVHKCNPNFPVSIQNLLQHLDLQRFNLLNYFPLVSQYITKIPKQLFYSIPAFEILLAYLLIEFFLAKKVFVITKKHKYLLLAAIILHLTIIIILLICHWNKVVIIWNLAMIMVLIWIGNILIASFQTHKNHMAIPLKYKSAVFYFITTVLPLLNFVGAWDNYLSWKLYSGNLPKGKYYLKSLEQRIIPKQLYENYKIICYDSIKKQYYIDFEAWLLAETHTYMYAEPRYFGALSDSLRNIE
jgi:hypothetical protein